MLPRVAALLFMSAVALAAPLAHADTIKVLTAGAFKQVVVALVPAFERSTGHEVEVQNDTAGGLARRIAGGEPFDVVVVPPSALQPLAADGKVDAADTLRTKGMTPAG